MKYSKQQKARKRILIILVIIIIAGMAVAYIMPMRAMADTQAPATPAPDNNFGTDYGYDDSTLPSGVEEDTTATPTPLPTLTIVDATITLDIGQSYTVQYDMENFPDNTMLEWSSSNPNVAAIGADGTVVGVSPGYTDVVATAGTLRASVLVTVNELKANRVTIVVGTDVAKQTGNNSYQLKVGDVVDLSAKIDPDGAKVNKITWTLGNDTVASITPNGQTCEFVANSTGQTLLNVSADTLVDAIQINIGESGIPIASLWQSIQFIIIVIVIVAAIAIIVTILLQKRRKEQARKKAAAAKRRREKEEAARRAREDAIAAEMQRDIRDPRPAQPGERLTIRISGAAVGAGIAEPGNKPEGPERPLTLDDLD